MAKADLLEFDDEVIELLPNATFRVRVENGYEIVALISGNMRKIASVFWPAIMSRWT